jgi:hypothetical protein
MGTLKIASRQVGEQLVNGTTWPVMDMLERRQYGERVEWVYSEGVCNGTACKATPFKTRRAACLAYADGKPLEGVKAEDRLMVLEALATTLYWRSIREPRRFAT